MTTTTQPTRWQAQHAATPATRLRWHLPVWIAFGTLGAVGIMSRPQWVSGVVLGLMIAGVGNHLRIFGRR